MLALHIYDHLKSCTLKQIKMWSSGKAFSQSQLRMTAQVEGKVNVESYVFHQETCREELCNMIVLHDYPLSIVDHAGFRRFVHAMQPLFKLHTRNTYRYIVLLFSFLHIALLFLFVHIALLFNTI